MEARYGGIVAQHFQAQCGDTGIVLIEMWELKPIERKEHALSGKDKDMFHPGLSCVDCLPDTTTGSITIKLNKGGDLSVYKEQQQKKIPVST